KRKRTGKALPTHHIAFEHLDEYLSKTARLLELNGMREHVDLRFAPLVPFTDINNQSYSYYNCRDAIKTLTEALDINISKVLLVVDGPPGSTNKHARYPALPMALEYMHGVAIDIIMDDYIRKDEKEIGKRW